MRLLKYFTDFCVCRELCLPRIAVCWCIFFSLAVFFLPAPAFAERSVNINLGGETYKKITTDAGETYLQRTVGDTTYRYPMNDDNVTIDGKTYTIVTVSGKQYLQNADGYYLVMGKTYYETIRDNASNKKILLQNNKNFNFPTNNLNGKTVSIKGQNNTDGSKLVFNPESQLNIENRANITLENFAIKDKAINGMLKVKNKGNLSLVDMLIDNASISKNESVWGAVILVDSVSQISIENSQFINNNQTSTADKSDTMVDRASGGVLYIQGNIKDGAKTGASNLAKLVNSTFTNNSFTATKTHTFGGAVVIGGNAGEISNNRFEGNYLLAQNTNTFAYGGAVTIGEAGKDTKQKFRDPALIDRMTDNTFISNHVTTEKKGYAYGGALSNSGKIGTGADSGNGSTTPTTLTGTFTGNYVKNNTSSVAIDNSDANAIGAGAYGGAVFNGIKQFTTTAIINALSGDFNGNYAESNGGMAYGGAIANSGEITNSLSGNFVNNYVQANIIEGDTDKVKAYGGAIYNGAIYGRYTPEGADNRYNTILYGPGSIGSISGVFTSNRALSNGGEAKGGAIYNNGTMGSISGVFKDNYAQSNGGEAKGGAIYTTKDLSIIASGTGALTKFSGNYVSTDSGTTKQNEAIYVASAAEHPTTLTFNATNGGTIQLDDYINGDEGYNLTMAADETSKILLNNVIKGKANATLTNVDVNWSGNNSFDTVEFSSLNSTNSRYSLDIDLTNKKADKIIAASGSGTILLLDNENIVNNLTNPTADYKIQIIQGSSSLQLALSEALSAKLNAKEYELSRTTGVNGSLTKDSISADTSWDTVYKQHQETHDVVTYGKLGLATTTTTNDSIGMNVSKVQNEKSKITSSALGDTLKLVNQAEIIDENGTSVEKNFKTDNASKTYIVTDNLGTTQGTLNIAGKTDETGNKSTIDLKGYDGFELNDTSTALNLSNVKLTDSTSADKNVITATTSNATIGIENSIIDGNIQGAGNNISFSGVSELNGNITNSTTNDNVISNSGTLTANGSISGNVTNNANSTLTSAIDNLQGSLTNNGTYNMTGTNVTLDKKIAGTGITVLDRGATLGFGNNAEIEGTLSLSGNTINMQESGGESVAYSNVSIGELKGTGSLKIDVDLTNKKADTITAKSGNGTITIESLNIRNGAITSLQKGDTIEIIKGSSSINLALSEALQQKNFVSSTSKSNLTSTDTISVDTLWGTKYYEHYKDYTEETYIKLATSGGNIVANKVVDETNITQRDVSLGDTLKLVNQDTTNATKNFTTADAGAIYEVTDNLGITKGTLKIAGKTDENGNKSTIDLKGYDGFELNDTSTALNLSNVKLTDSTSADKNVITATTSNATIGITDSIIAGNIQGAGTNISFSGVSELNGNITNSTTNDNVISNSGTLTANGSISGNVTNNANSTLTANGTITGDVANSGTFYANSSISGNVTNNVNSTLTANGTITAENIDNRGIIDNTSGTLIGKLINSGTITGGNITAKDGTINSGSINGSTVEIEQDFANEGKISGTINISNTGNLANSGLLSGSITNGGVLTSSLETINGTLVNNGIFKATGGELNSVINGTGSTEITGNVNINGGSFGTSQSISVLENSNLNIGSQVIEINNFTLRGTLDITVTNLVRNTSVYEGGRVLVNNADLSGGKLSFTIALGLLNKGEKTDDISVISLTNGATGSIIGDLSSIFENNNRYDIQQGSSAGSVIIKNTAAAEDIAGQVGNQNNRNTAAAWERASFAPNTQALGVQEVLNSLSQHDKEGFRLALNQVAPSDSQFKLENTRMIQNLISNETTRNFEEDGCTCGKAFKRTSMWMQALGGYNRQSDSFEHQGFKSHTTGYILGYDGSINCQTSLGFGYAYAKSDGKSHSKDMNISSHNMFVYGKYQPLFSYVRGALLYGLADNREKTAIGQYGISSDYDTHYIGAETYVGYEYLNGITPEIGVRYTYLMPDDYTDSLGQKIKNKDISALTLAGRLNYKKEFALDNGIYIKPEIYAGVTYDMNDTSTTTQVSLGQETYTIRSKRVSRFGGEGGVNMSISKENIDVILSYDTSLKKGYTEQTGMLKFRYNF